MAISYKGTGRTAVTMMTAGEVEPGMAVTLTAADTVGVGAGGRSMLVLRVDKDAGTMVICL